MRNATITVVVLGMLGIAFYLLGSRLRVSELRPGLKIERSVVEAETFLFIFQPAGRGGEIGLSRLDASGQPDASTQVVANHREERQVFEWHVPGLRHGDVIRVNYRRGLSLVSQDLEVPAAAGALKSP